MTSAAMVALAVAAAAAVADWTAKARGRGTARRATKPAVMVALAVVASTVEPLVDAQRWWVLAALAAGLVGDVELLRGGVGSLVTGAGAFVVGHVCYVAGFVARDAGLTLPAGLLVVVVIAAWTLPAVRRGARRRGGPGLAAGVVAYVVVLAGLVAGAILAGGPVAVAGAMVFALADLALLRDRFVGDERWLGVAATAGYHLAQALLVLALIV